MTMSKENRDTIISSLYERCSNGEISVSQREALIQKTNSMFFATEFSKQNTSNEDNVVEESVENNIEETTVEESVDEEIIDSSIVESNLSPKEKYNLFKESVYERYSKGDIGITVREELLEKARDKFFTFSE